MFHKMSSASRIVNKKIRNALNDAIHITYGLQARALRDALVPPVYRLREMHMLYNDHKKYHHYRLNGISNVDGSRFSVALLGIWEYGVLNNIAYFIQKLFVENTASTQYLGECSSRQMRSLAEEIAPEVDLILFHGHNLILWEPKAGEWVITPEKLRSVFDFTPGETWEQVSARFRQKSNLKRLSRANYTYEISTRFEDFELFYDRMYVPLVKSRYHDYGSIETRENMTKDFNQHGKLLLIRSPSGEVVSAAFNYTSRNVFYGVVNGVLDGREDLIKEGALAACYYFCLKFAHERGFHRLDSGRSDPFLSDGVFRHKQQWGFTGALDYWAPYAILMWAPAGSQPAVSWMQANPVIPQFARFGGGAMTGLYHSLMGEAETVAGNS